ncbi:MAG: hypothetical protein Q4G71_17145 [Pseudomonadota bacterium]|nr:hypothetical protein [Pseudomonadota bacterium]
MKTRFATLAVLSALLASTAYATMPAAGEHPLFNDTAPAAATTLSRTQVQAQARAQMPAAGDAYMAFGHSGSHAGQSREQVQQQTRVAAQHGFPASVGEQG